MKGYIYTLEVLLAIALIIGALVTFMGNANPQSNYASSSMPQQVFDALKYMDTKGDLRVFVKNNDTASIITNLTALLPDTIKFDVDICTSDCSTTVAPNDRTVVAIDYFVSGYKDEFAPNRVHVWIWEKY